MMYSWTQIIISLVPLAFVVFVLLVVIRGIAALVRFCREMRYSKRLELALELYDRGELTRAQLDRVSEQVIAHWDF